jgi:hypothetical protein
MISTHRFLHFSSLIKMVKREYREIEDEDETASPTPFVVKDEPNDRIILSALITPKKKANSTSTKSTKSTKEGEVGDRPPTPKSKSPAKSVCPSHSHCTTSIKADQGEMVVVRG